MNKYFLLAFTLVLLALDLGLRAGQWLNPSQTKVQTKIKVVKVKSKAPPPIVKVVTVEVPAAPAACEPVVQKKEKKIARAVSSVRKWKKDPVAPAPVVVAKAPDAEPIVVENIAPQKPLEAPSIKSIQTEE